VIFDSVAGECQPGGAIGILSRPVVTGENPANHADLEKDVRPWVKPWNAEHAAGRITRPRHNGQPYSGINILSLWMSATAQNFAAPIWMTFRQALELDAHVRKGEKGSLVVYANSITRTEHDDKTGEDVEREIPYMEGYTVFNVEQIDGLPEIYYAKAGIHARPRGPHRGKIVLRASRQSPDHRALRVIRFPIVRLLALTSIGKWWGFWSIFGAT